MGAARLCVGSTDDRCPRWGTPPTGTSRARGALQHQVLGGYVDTDRRRYGSQRASVTLRGTGQSSLWNAPNKVEKERDRECDEYPLDEGGPIGDAKESIWTGIESGDGPVSSFAPPPTLCASASNLDRPISGLLLRASSYPLRLRVKPPSPTRPQHPLHSASGSAVSAVSAVGDPLPGRRGTRRGRGSRHG